MTRLESDLHEAPRLVLRFAVYAALALVLAAVGALLLARFDATSKAENDLADDAAYIADELGRDDLARTSFKARVGDGEEAQLDDFLGRVAAARDVMRVSLVGRDGTVTYSTDHAAIGTRASARAGVEAARAGHGRVVSGDERIGAYVPVHWLLETARPRGVLVAERTTDAVAAEAQRQFVTQAGLVVLALLLLYAALIPVFRRVTAALAVREARYRALMEQASDGIGVFDRDGRLLQANPMLARMTGYARDELLGLQLKELIAPDDLEHVPLRFGEVLEGKTVLQERKLVRQDGSFFLGEFHATLLADGLVVASLRDISERRRLERELREAQKLEAVGRFAGGIAERFAELLESVARNADALAARLGADADVEELRSSAAWGRSLTSQLLAVGSKQAFRPQVLDLNATLGGMRPMLAAIAGEGVDVVLRPADAVDRVVADPDQLEKVIVDLVMHARVAMPGGGTLTVETANVDFSANGRSRRRAAGPHVMLAISDTGDRRDHAARPLFAKSEQDGGEPLGIGLAAVYGVVHQSGGSIGVESEPGMGTTVRIYLPSAEPELARALGSAQTA